MLTEREPATPRAGAFKIMRLFNRPRLFGLGDPGSAHFWRGHAADQLDRAAAGGSGRGAFADDQEERHDNSARAPQAGRTGLARH